MSTFTFTWPAGPQEVILTGTFDNWSKTLFLVKKADGSFELTVPLPSSDEPLLYKYVVDGEWVVSQSQKISKDESGNENNVIDKDDLVSASAKGSIIPESGLPVTGAAGATAAAVAAVGGSDLKTTVLPKEEPSHPTIAGEPGIVIPKDPEALEAFKTVSDVDPKTLNGEAEPELSAEEKKKQKKKVKKSKYKAKKKSAKSGTDGTSTEEQTPEPEAPVAAEAAAVPAVVAATEAPVTAASDDATITAKKIEEPVPEPVVEEPVAVAAAEPAGDAGIHTLDPKAHQADTSAENIPEPTIEEHPAPSIEKTTAPVLPESVLPLTEEKEVDASPVAKTEEVEEAPAAVPVVAESKKEIADEEEIVVTQGGDINNLKEAIAATEGDVTIEEIKPTESEAERLTKEANIPKETAAKPEKVAAPAPAKKEAAKKTEKKEKKGFLSKLKKIFK